MLRNAQKQKQLQYSIPPLFRDRKYHPLSNISVKFMAHREHPCIVLLDGGGWPCPMTHAYKQKCGCALIRKVCTGSEPNSPYYRQ